ncbi:MAG TPA: TonB-dependent receptor [Methylomirabilota bacterium]|nr:TonB-dependent receptor [Methylomirabilota bacterium]
MHTHRIHLAQFWRRKTLPALPYIPVMDVCQLPLVFILLVAWLSEPVLVLYTATSWAQTSQPMTLPTVTVRGATPLMSVPLPQEQIPVNTQVSAGEEYTASGALNLTDFFARDLAGISLTHVQNNPFQPDVVYRGFTSSFLLGTPPGLSVFVDGARINEPLADQVNWDLLPSDAIERIELIPGSNPVFGRNTLGGAIVMQTKRGRTNPGTTAELWGGSFGRIRSLLQTGGTRGNVDYFLSGNWFTEDGFRDFSASAVGQLFGKLGYVAGAHDVTLSLTYTNNYLTGNGPLPESRLIHDRSEVFTHPDRFRPELWFVNGQYTYDLGSGLTLTANGYGRFLRLHQFNRDVAEDVLGDTRQDGWGSAAQLTYQNTLWGIPVTTAAGLDYSGATVRHRIADRALARNGDDDEDEENALRRTQAQEEESPFAPSTDVIADTHAGGAFVTFTAEPTEKLTVTAAGRFDTTALTIKDLLAQATAEEKQTDASGSHRFERFNPAIGATYALPYGFSLYANYSQSYRAPTAIELTCANPQAPCPIPTAIVDDPPLKPVKGKTWETGLRWTPFPTLHGVLTFFRTDLDDDILFRNEPQSRVLGFFQNVKATRRQGIEFMWRGAWSRGRWFANYTLTDATFETNARLFTFANEERIALVQKGDTLPLVPVHRLNGGVDLFLTPRWRLRVDAAYVGSQYLRGDEANQRRRLDPYFVTNAKLTYSYRNAEVFFRLENVFDANYETYGAFFENELDHTGIERFLGPGTPLGAFGGVRVHF